MFRKMLFKGYILMYIPDIVLTLVYSCSRTTCIVYMLRKMLFKGYILMYIQDIVLALLYSFSTTTYVHSTYIC